MKRIHHRGTEGTEGTEGEQRFNAEGAEIAEGESVVDEVPTSRRSATLPPRTGRGRETRRTRGQEGCEEECVVDQRVPTRRSRTWVRWVTAIVAVAVLIGMFVVPAVLRSRCGAQQIMESTSLRATCAELAQRARAEQDLPRSVAELVYEGVLDIERFDRGCTDCDLSKVRIGKYSARQIAQKRMTRAALDAAIAQVHPDGIAWERFGPVVVCLDARAYTEPLSTRIVGWNRSAASWLGTNGWCNVSFADGHVSVIHQQRDEQREAEALKESIAYYDCLGIPMPEEMVRELRAVVGTE